MRIHLDTDLGGDTDDVCALAYLLGLSEVELTGVTTVLDGDGRRAGYTAYVLELAGRDGVPVAAGAGASLTTGAADGPVVDDPRHWPLDVPLRPDPPGAALDLLATSVEAGAVLVGIGPYTNLALLETARPGTLGRAHVVLMGGWFSPPAPGLPQWGPEMDFNVQYDVRAAEIVLAAAGELTLATLPATLAAAVRPEQLAALRAGGPLGELLAAQAVAHAEEFDAQQEGVLNYQYDPVACGIAAGRPVGTVEDRRISWRRDGAGCGSATTRRAGPPGC